ncbi:MAG TPA: DJ-1/PfpI family protein [Thermoanaerobaculia bacterium]|nr:DJ-1/PfpI family protein [Thermoanaerobaculia bacterium]
MSRGDFSMLRHAMLIGTIAAGALDAAAAPAQVVMSRTGNSRLQVPDSANAASETARREETSDVTKNDGPLHLGIVLYPGFEPLDVFGPLEMFMNVGSERLRIHMIAEHAGLVPSSTGGYASSIAPKVEATVSLADAPPLDIIMVPGGFGTMQQLQNATLLAWLRERAATARFTTSVCSGSAILAKAGILDGKKATSNKQMFSFLASQGPAVDWQKSARWVEDGAVITSSGVSAGIDMALSVIAKLFGTETAEQIAAGTEYEWHRDPTEDPFTQYLDQGLQGLTATTGQDR